MSASGAPPAPKTLEATLREALDMVTRTPPESAVFRPEFGKRLRALLRDAIAALETSSQPATAGTPPVTDADVEQLAVVARRAQREWWSKSGDVSEGQKWVYIVREVLATYNAVHQSAGLPQDAMQFEEIRRTMEDWTPKAAAMLGKIGRLDLGPDWEAPTIRLAYETLQHIRAVLQWTPEIIARRAASRSSEAPK